MSGVKWQIGPVKLTNGEEALIDAIIEGQEAYRYTGRIKSHGQWESTGWDDTGRRMYSELNHPYNLAPPPKKTVRVQRWLNIDADGTVSLYELRSEADTHCFSDRIACVEIDCEVEEGEGL
jgi:hypothetical protein